MTRAGLTLILVACCIVLTGCQEAASDIAPVDGIILFNGMPARASITAQAVNETGNASGRPSTADTRPDGSFSLQYADQQSGAVIGPQQLTICVFPHERAEGEFNFSQRFHPVKVVKLMRTVLPGSDNHWKFFLTF
jgi:hypothetical protein